MGNGVWGTGWPADFHGKNLIVRLGTPLLNEIIFSLTIHLELSTFLYMGASC